MFKLFAVDTYFNWGDGTIQGLLNTVVGWLAGGVGLGVLIGLIYGAILYTTAAGNASQSKKGIEVIRNSAVALILFFAMYGALKLLGVKGVLGL